jgi:hypothetical protein
MVLKGLRTLLLIALGLGILSFNWRLYYAPKFTGQLDQDVNQDLLGQLHYLNAVRANGGPEKMQAIYPEGFVFFNALYALSWAEVLEHQNPESTLYSEGLEEVNQVLYSLNSDEAKNTFDRSLQPEYGIFYRGWCNYVLGRKLKLQDPERRDSLDCKLFQTNCDEIQEALNKSENPFLPSYYEACWPADMTVAMASLKQGEDLFPGSYQNTISSWLLEVEKRTDSLGLIPHAVNASDGKVSIPARGSSQSLILNFLFEIDSTYARQKMDRYTTTFLRYHLGLPGICEYPNEAPGSGDIDSGPVVWGIGGAASIVGQRVFAQYGQPEVAIGLRNSIELFGMGWNTRESKSYLFGEFPMADAFIAWSNSTEAHRVEKLVSKKPWRLKIQLVSILLLALVIWRLYKIY